MPLPPRLFPGDEELGKRDDDHKPGTKNTLGHVWRQRRLPHGPPRRSMKRAALVVLALVALFYFFKNMPTDLRNPRPRPYYGDPPGKSSAIAGSRRPPSVSEGATPSHGHEETAEKPQHDYNGPIKFYQLASSLHAFAKSKGPERINRNVVSSGRLLFIHRANNMQLFAAASLKSASTLLPIACEMAIRERNDVHFAFMGRDDISMDMLKSINGVAKECKIIYHGIH